MPIQLEMFCTSMEFSPGEWETTWSLPGCKSTDGSEKGCLRRVADLAKQLAPHGITVVLVAKYTKIYYPKEW